MTRRKEYQRLLNSKRWRELRIWKLNKDPLCERCKEDGYIRSAIDVHHIRPVESAKDEKEMEALCFDSTNLRSLCIPCHVKTHKEMGKASREEVKRRREDRLREWMERNKPLEGSDDAKC